MTKLAIQVKTSKVTDPETGGEVEVMRITDFCRCVNKNNQQVHKLMYEGNKVRKLKFIAIAGTKFIHVSEVTEFPFTVSGRSDSFYHYDEKGKEITDDSSKEATD